MKIGSEPFTPVHFCFHDRSERENARRRRDIHLVHLRSPVSRGRAPVRKRASYPTLPLERSERSERDGGVVQPGCENLVHFRSNREVNEVNERGEGGR